jgi:hypothetical protein
MLSILLFPDGRVQRFTAANSAALRAPVFVVTRLTDGHAIEKSPLSPPRTCSAPRSIGKTC